MKVLDEIPILLREINNPPEKLYYEGNFDILEKPCIAIVGTRKYSDYGEMATKQIVKELSVLDIAIVSGLAKGIDTIAHKAAIENQLPTIAFLGSGLDEIYPKENYELAKQICKDGLIVSEYPSKTQPKSMHFPQRNRLVSGISLATVVIEAPEKSGALITAYLAIDQGREVYVVPGDIDRINSKGIIKLLQKGAAYAIGSGKDIVANLMQQPHLFKKKEKSQDKSPENFPEIGYRLTEEEKKIFRFLPRYRLVTVDKIAEGLNRSTTSILTDLSILEIYGLVKTENGKYRRTC
ncbi:MAG: DNA-processing protein DprA [bacterium]|nr:DNA-processing protein DprA [bacterium]